MQGTGGLFRKLNTLLLAVLNRRPAQELIALVDVFVAEPVQHFQDEEAIITQAGYSIGFLQTGDIHVISLATLVCESMGGQVCHWRDF